MSDLIIPPVPSTPLFEDSSMFSQLMDAVESGEDIDLEIIKLQNPPPPPAATFDYKNKDHLKNLPPNMRKKVVEDREKAAARREFLKLNGIVIVVDDRIVDDHCKKLQIDVWGCNTASIERMEKQIQLKGFFVRSIKLKERIRLTEKLRVMIDQDLAQDLATKKNEKAKEKQFVAKIGKQLAKGGVKKTVLPWQKPLFQG